MHSLKPFHDLPGIHHGGLQGFMAKELLHIADIHPVHQQVGGTAVPQGMGADSLLFDSGLLEAILQAVSHRGLGNPPADPAQGHYAVFPALG